MSDHMKPQRKAVGRLAESSQTTFISPTPDFSPQLAATPQTAPESLTNVQPSSASPEQILEQPEITQTPFVGHNFSQISVLPKLSISQPDDPAEREADCVAEQVMRMPELVNAQDSMPGQWFLGHDFSKISVLPPTQPAATPIFLPEVQRKCAACEAEEEENLMRQEDGSAQTPEAVSDRVSEVLQNEGRPLDVTTRAFMEPRFGHDFSQVRVHDNSQAAESAQTVNALAYTVEQDVAFGAGQYAPGTTEGRKLLAHELTHVVQQEGTGDRPQFPEAGTKTNTTDISEAATELKSTKAMAEGSSSGTASPLQPLASPADAPAKATSTNALSNSANSTGAPQNPASTSETISSPEAKAEAEPVARNTAKSDGVVVSGGSIAASTPPDGGNGFGGSSGSGSSTPLAPMLDTSSAEGLLQSLASAPASSFIPGVTTAKEASAQIQAQEKADLEANLPEVEQPTGLPQSTGRKKPDVTVPERGQAPEVPMAGAGNRVSKPDEPHHEVANGPLPGSQVSTAVSAPRDDGGGSWWNWLFNRVQNFLGALPSTDPGLSTSAGSRQRVELSGDANPSQNAQYQQASDREVVVRRTQADTATTADFGENSIYPTLSTQKLRPTYKPSPAQGTQGGSRMNPPALPDDVRAAFDQNETPLVSTQINERIEQHRSHQAKYQKESQDAHEEGQRRIAEENEQVRAKQEGLQQQARSEVGAERQRWCEENRKVQEKYSIQSEAKRQEIDQQIQQKVQTTEQDADQKLTEAETKTETERQKTEAQVDQKKRDAENKPRSFWDSVKDSISSVFDELKQGINALFEGLRKLVKDIIEAAKAVVRRLIDAARDAIVGMIKGFGELIKGLVSVVLIAFPETAAKARAWIDNKIDATVDAVNAAAEALKRTTDAILDGVGKALDVVLSVFQGAFNLILDGLEFLAKAPFEAMELLAKLMDLLEEYGPFLGGLEKLQTSAAEIEAAAKETLQGMINQVPAKAHEAVETAMQKVGKPLQKHLEGIWRHLEPGLEHLRANWWGEIKQMVWTLVWPFNDKSPIWKDVPELLKLPGEVMKSLWNGQFSQAIDQFLKIA